MMRPIWILLSAALVASACAKSEDVILVGEVGSMTGPEATFGQSTHKGIQLAIDELNQKGGIKGKKIRLRSVDDQGKPEEAVSAVTALITRDKVVAVLGEVASKISLQMAPKAQALKVPMISPSSTNVRVTQVGDYIFRVCFIDPFQGQVMARFAKEQLNATQVAVLRDVASDYSQGLGQYFAQTFTALGGQIVADESYSKDDIDYKAQLTKIIAAAPEAMFIPGYYTNVGLIAKQARELGYQGIFIGGDGWDSSKLAEIGGKAIEGAFFTNHYSTDDPNPSVQGFIQKYKAKYNEVPDGLAALGYDAAQVLYLAMSEVAKDPAMAAAFGDRSSVPATEPARKQARAALRDALAKVSAYPGVTGSITIDAERNAQKPAVVVEVLAEPGKYKFVEAVAP